MLIELFNPLFGFEFSAIFGCAEVTLLPFVYFLFGKVVIPQELVLGGLGQAGLFKLKVAELDFATDQLLGRFKEFDVFGLIGEALVWWIDTQIAVAFGIHFFKCRIVV